MERKKSSVDALILAGASNSGQLSECSPVLNKALIDVGSKTLLEYVVDALKASLGIGRIVVVGPNKLIRERIGGDAIDIIVESGDSFIDNIIIGLDAFEGAQQILMVTSDIPLLTPAAVDDFLERCSQREAQVYYSVISKETVEKRYPGTKRTYVRLADGEFTGGNVALVSLDVIRSLKSVLKKVTQMRKKPWQLGTLLGARCMMKFLLGTLSIDDIERRVEKAFNFKGAAIITPYPEIGVDVDKPEDITFVKELLGG